MEIQNIELVKIVEMQNIELVKNYYSAMNNKDIESMAQYFHDDIHFFGPLSDRKGKQNLIEASKIFITLINGLEIREIFASGNKIMLAYDIYGKEPVGTFRVAALVTVKDNMIFQLELFYDSMPFENRRKEIENEK